MMKKKVALVLSGGGARGISHIGVICELERQGYEITSVTGTSMGSVVGGVYALGKLDAFRDWLYTLDKLKVFRLMDFTLSRQGLLRGEKVFNTMKEFMEDANIEDLRIPFAAVAVNLTKMEEVVFSKGSVYDAIRASVAIPAVITPVKTKDGLLVDGGVMNNLPVKHAIRTEGDMVIAVDVNAGDIGMEEKETREEREDRNFFLQRQLNGFYNYLGINQPSKSEDRLGYFDLVNRTIMLMTHHMAQLSLEKYAPDLLISVSGESCGVFDFYKAREMVERGRKAARKQLKEFTGKG